VTATSPKLTAEGAVGAGASWGAEVVITVTFGRDRHAETPQAAPRPSTAATAAKTSGADFFLRGVSSVAVEREIGGAPEIGGGGGRLALGPVMFAGSGGGGRPIVLEWLDPSPAWS